MSNLAEQDPPATKRKSSDFFLMTAIAVVTAIAAAAIWGLLRAYTGVFDILNLRVFVAAFVLVAPLALVPAAAFAASGWQKILLIFMPVVAAIPVVGGELMGSFLSGKPVILQRFNLTWLGILVIFTLIACVGAVVKKE